jgi:hypothetical protein
MTRRRTLELAYRGNDHQSLPVCKVEQVALPGATAVAMQSVIADTMNASSVIVRARHRAFAREWDAYSTLSGILATLISGREWEPEGERS